MKIIILGAGQLGASIVNILASESNDISVVDTDIQLLGELQDRLDIKTVVGHASHPQVLKRAGADDADMIIAVTLSDDTNMVACQVAYTLFHVPTKIARIRSQAYLAFENNLFVQEAFPVDVIISPEQTMTQYIKNLVDYQGALQVLDFASGRVQLVVIKTDKSSPLVGKQLRAIKTHLPDKSAKIIVIYREGKAIFPNGGTVIEANDEVFFLAGKNNVRPTMREFIQVNRPVKRIMLAGGGNVGRLLAKSLEKTYQVKVIEHNVHRVKALAASLNNTLILKGDAADEELLHEENIDSTDVFCALTNDDEANILSAMLAKRMGCGKVMSIVNRPAYIDIVVESAAIDIAISPRQVTIGSLLAHIRRGDVVAVHSLRRGAAEAIEAVAHGDKHTSKVVGRRISELSLPDGTTIGAVVRGSDVLMLDDSIVIQPNDHIILFMADKRNLPKVERLFQVNVGFI